MKTKKKREKISTKSMRAEWSKERREEVQKAKQAWEEKRRLFEEDLAAGKFAASSELREYLRRQNEVTMAKRHYKVLSQKINEDIRPEYHLGIGVI